MWVKVDDGFPEHHKVLAAGEHLGANGAGRVAAVWLESMCYANRHLTDGFIAEAVARRFHLDKNPVEVLRAMALKSVRLMTRVDGGWKVHDYLEYQPSKADVQEKRRKERDRKRSVRTDSARTPPGIRPESDDLPRHVHAESADPVPIRPVPARDQEDQDQRASHAVLVRLAHDVLKDTPPEETKDELKRRAARARLIYDATAITKALDSAEAQRKRASA